MLKDAALVVAAYKSVSTNQTKTCTRFWTARSISEAMSESMFGSSMCGVMNKMARFMPTRGVGMETVSIAMDNDCRLGVVARKSGWKEFRLTSQSLALACEMIGPAIVTRLKSSGVSAGKACAQALSVCTIR